MEHWLPLPHCLFICPSTSIWCCAEHSKPTFCSSGSHHAIARVRGDFCSFYHFEALPSSGRAGGAVMLTGLIPIVVLAADIFPPHAESHRNYSSGTDFTVAELNFSWCNIERSAADLGANRRADTLPRSAERYSLFAGLSATMRLMRPVQFLARGNDAANHGTPRCAIMCSTAPAAAVFFFGEITSPGNRLGL